MTPCSAAGEPDYDALRLANELDHALEVLSKFDEGPDLVLFYKRLMVLEGNAAYEHHINETDSLSNSQRAYIDTEWRSFREWWDSWPGATKERV
jgi:4-hydroxy-tetrahydrodipicolinate synthase